MREGKRRVWVWVGAHVRVCVCESDSSCECLRMSVCERVFLNGWGMKCGGELTKSLCV